MSDRDDSENPNPADLTAPSSSSCSSLIATLRTLFQSVAVLLRHPLHFAAIYAATALPLSLLLFSLAVSAHPIETRVRSLETLARLRESRAEALSALRLRAAYALPCLAFSLAALASSAHSASAAVSGRRPTLTSAAAAVRDRWLRVLVTSICVYAAMWAFLSVAGTLGAVLAGFPFPRFSVFLIGSLLEVYLMAVLGVGMVVSALEDRVGFEAIRVGSAIMEGRRWSGFFLSGLLVLSTGSIWRVMERLMDGQDWTSVIGMVRWMAGIRWRAWLVPLYGLLVLWSYVVSRFSTAIAGEGRITVT